MHKAKLVHATRRFRRRKSKLFIIDNMEYGAKRLMSFLHAAGRNPENCVQDDMLSMIHFSTALPLSLPRTVVVFGGDRECRRGRTAGPVVPAKLTVEFGGDRISLRAALRPMRRQPGATVLFFDRSAGLNEKQNGRRELRLNRRFAEWQREIRYR